MPGPFPDVPGNHPAAAAITKLKNLGALQGYDSGRFEPDAPLTRAELAKILVLARPSAPQGTPVQIPDSDPQNFPGDPNYPRFYVHIQQAVANGIVPMTGPTTFSPWVVANELIVGRAIETVVGTAPALQNRSTISRAQFCMLLVDALGL